jgi:hypothetical protein
MLAHILCGEILGRHALGCSFLTCPVIPHTNWVVQNNCGVACLDEENSEVTRWLIVDSTNNFIDASTYMLC